MKTCRTFRARIHGALDGSLPIEAVFALEEHVRGCAACRTVYQRERDLDAALARLPGPPVERVDVERALAGIRATIDREAVAQPRRRFWLPLSIAAAAAAVLLFFLLRRAPVDERAPPIAASTTRPPAPSPTPPPVAEIAEPPEAAIDPARLARARDEVRCLLASAAEALPPWGEARAASEFAAAVDEGARDLERSRWPVLRLAEGAIADADPAVARAALRYVGARADRLSVRTLEAAFARPESRIDAALALCDAGDVALDALASPLRDPATRGFVLARLADRGGDGAARVVETSIRVTAMNAADRTACIREGLDALARIGGPAVPAILRLGSEGTLSSDETIDALAATEGAAEVVAGFVTARPKGVQDGLVLRALAALQPARALPLLERRALEVRERRREVIECIAWYGSEGGLAALLRLAASGRIAEDDLEDAILATLDRDRNAGRAVVEDWARAGRRVELSVFQRFLLGHPVPAAAPALVAFGGTEFLPTADRRWSLLLAGELGIPVDAELLADLFQRLKPSEKDLKAACLLSIRALAGSERVELLVETLPPRNARRVVAVLADADARSRPITTLTRLARELENALATSVP
ncbi:MAG TPA: zf-HC2 domain-containing protein [Planctomycetota bacterium]|nr:zf-HC2 domain-containing protein [Planctomycetota bacterium]